MVVFLQIWSAVGPLLGICFGAYLSRSWQRKQWTLAEKRTEYRELLSTLSRSVRTIINNSPGLWSGGLSMTSGEQEKQVMEADSEARSVIEDRIFVHDTVQREKILERWQLIAGEQRIDRFLDYWGSLHKTLVEAAHEDLGI